MELNVKIEEGQALVEFDDDVNPLPLGEAIEVILSPITSGYLPPDVRKDLDSATKGIKQLAAGLERLASTGVPYQQRPDEVGVLLAQAVDIEGVNSISVSSPVEGAIFGLYEVPDGFIIGWEGGSTIKTPFKYPLDEWIVALLRYLARAKQNHVEVSCRGCDSFVAPEYMSEELYCPDCQEE